jgi:isoleucyl-tRNA synthetase
MTISDEILKRVVESYRRIRNTLRFLLANTADFDVQRDALPVDEWLEIDRYALALVSRLQMEVIGDYARYEFHLVVQKLQTFCSEQLGGFYLDILKDRLYTTAQNSRARRSAQNALHHISHSLVRLMAPILSFTAEEAWEVLSAQQGRERVSASMAFPTDLPETDGQVLVQNWTTVCNWRARINKHIEEVRAAGLIGQALAAEVEIYAAGESFDALARLGDDLRFVLITSRATMHRVTSEAEERIEVTPSKNIKCERCWHYRADVGSDPQNATLCGRCVSNLLGDGEVRKYA